MKLYKKEITNFPPLVIEIETQQEFDVLLALSSIDKRSSTPLETELVNYTQRDIIAVLHKLNFLLKESIK